jgi:hypothetical protein
VPYVVYTPEGHRKIKRAVEQSRYRYSNNNRQGGGPRSDRGGWRPGGLIPFLNSTQETVPRYGVMRIVPNDPGDMFIKIAKPTTSFAGLYLVNALYDVGPEKMGFGSFLTSESFNWRNQFALYNDAATPAVGESWGAVSDSWMLHRNGPGFYILGGRTGSGDNARVAAIQYDVTRILGKTDSTVTGGSTVTVSVWGGTSGSETDSGLEVTGCRLLRGFIPASTFVYVEFINGQPYIVGDHRTVVGKVTGGLAKGASGSFLIYSGGSSTGVSVNATALGAEIPANKWATAFQEESGTWYCAPWECS